MEQPPEVPKRKVAVMFILKKKHHWKHLKVNMEQPQNVKKVYILYPDPPQTCLR